MDKLVHIYINFIYFKPKDKWRSNPLKNINVAYKILLYIFYSKCLKGKYTQSINKICKKKHVFQSINTYLNSSLENNKIWGQKFNDSIESMRITKFFWYSDDRTTVVMYDQFRNISLYFEWYFYMDHLSTNISFHNKNKSNYLVFKKVLFYVS